MKNSSKRMSNDDGHSLAHSRMYTRLTLTRILVFFIFTTLAAINTLFSQDFTYHQSTPQVDDTARVISRSDFDAPRLMELLRQFATDECRKRSLARLIVSVDQLSLANTINSSLPGSISGAQVVAVESAALDAAEAFCLQGEATAFVRRGRDVKQEQILGQRNARELKIEGNQLTVVGFRLRTGSTGPSDPRPLPDRVWIYARIANVPDLETAAAMRADLEKSVGTEVYLIVRPDSYFFDFDGPITDAFEVSGKGYSRQSYLAQPSLVCRPGSKHASCELVPSQIRGAMQ